MTNRYLIIQTIVILITELASCQAKKSVRQTDTITELAVHYLNTNMPDSFYKLTDKEFEKKITPTMWTSVYKEKIVPLLPLNNVTFITSNDSVSVYKLDGKEPITCYVSLDKQNKLSKFYFRPYQGEIKTVIMNEN